MLRIYSYYNIFAALSQLLFDKPNKNDTISIYLLLGLRDEN
jgi:hypothetical protein